MRKLAQFISYIFIPPINLFLIFTVLSIIIYEEQLKIMISISIALIFGLLLPIIFFMYLRFKGKIIDNNASKPNQRSIPYLFGAVFCIIAWSISIYLNLHQFIISLWISYILVTILIFVINLYWKISAHASGISIPFAVIVFVYGSTSAYFIVIPLIVAWARIYLKFHTLSQVLAGFLLGYTITLLVLNYSLEKY